MALAKERSSTTGPDSSSSSSHMNFIHVYGNNMYGGTSTSLVHRQQSISDPSFGFHDHENYTKMVLDDDEEGSDGSEKTSGSGGGGGNKNYYTMNRLPFLADPTSSTNIMLNEDMNSSPEESHHHHHNEGLINFKGGFDHWMHSSGSLLSFGERTLPDIHNVYPRIPQEEDESPNWDSVMCTSTDQNYQWSHAKSTSMVEPRIPGDLNSFETTTIKDDQHGVERFGWLYSGGGSDDSLQESGTSETNFLKRPRSDCEIQATKASKKPKPSKNVTPAKDPQSLAAKNRRERISERLKTLQDLVPNGSKVDLVTMLEKAISYVKFLQLQVKVLATDEFWPTQGGKAPEVTQVKEAIDAILSTHRDRRSSSPK